MGAANRYGSLAVGVYGSHQPGTVLPMAEARWGALFNYERREPATWRDPCRWLSAWSFGALVNGGNGSGQDGSAPLGRDLSVGNGYGPFTCDGAGHQGIKFLLGLCVDAGGAAVANPIVRGFVTSSNVFTGEAQAQNDGSFQVPSQFPGVDHYLVAYKDGSPDIAGTSINTLQPTNLDGTT